MDSSIKFNLTYTLFESHLESEIAQHFERGARKQPFLDRGPQCQRDLAHFVDDHDAGPPKVFAQAVVQTAAGASLHANMLSRAARVRSRKGAD